MNKSTIIIVSLLIGAIIGHLFSKSFVKPKYVYDFEDCIVKCERMLPLDSIKQIRDRCIRSIPKPNLEICEHVAPQNRIACLMERFQEYDAQIQPCLDAYDSAVKELLDCQKECDNLILNIVTKSK